MYGGLAAAMQQNNANAFRLFGIKNDLDQQRQRQAQLERANAIQDKGLLWAEQDRATAAQDRTKNQTWAEQDRATRAEDRTRNQRREDEEFGRHKAESELRLAALKQAQEQQAKALAEQARAEGFHDVANTLMSKGRLDAEDVDKFNSLGTMKLIERSDAATYDPQTGNVRLRWADGTGAEMPMQAFLARLEIQGGAPARGHAAAASAASGTGPTAVNGKLLFDLSEAQLKDAGPDLEKFDKNALELQKLNQEMETLKKGWFNGGQVEAKSKEIAAKEAAQAALQEKIAKVTGTAMKYRDAAAAAALGQAPGQANGGLRYIPTDAPFDPGQAAGNGLLPAQGQAGAPGAPQAQAQAAPTPDEARRNFDKALAVVGAEDKEATATVVEKNRGQRIENDRQKQAAYGDTPTTFGGLIDSVPLRAVAKKFNDVVGWPVRMAVEGNSGRPGGPGSGIDRAARLGQGIAAGAKSVAADAWLATWNASNPDRLISPSDFDVLSQEAERLNVNVMKLVTAGYTVRNGRLVGPKGGGVVKASR